MSRLKAHIRSLSGLFAGPLVGAAVLSVLLTVLAVPFAEKTHAQLPEEEPEFVNPHDFSRKEYCRACHGESPPALSFDPVTTCTKCHMGNVGNHPVARHPVGSAPRINIAAYLPLSKGGLLVCYTCHDQHNTSGHPKMLRVEYLRLCASCHRGY